MSTNFIPDATIPMDALRVFNKHGVKAETDDGGLTLTDGNNWLRVYPGSKSDPMMFERCGDNDPSAIVKAVGNVRDRPVIGRGVVCSGSTVFRSFRTFALLAGQRIARQKVCPY